MTTEQLEHDLDQTALSVNAQPWRLMPHDFARHCKLAVPGGTFQVTRLAAYLGELIADEIWMGGARLLINVAPRQGKSELVSYALPTWFLDTFPNERVILSTHTASLALDFGRRVRNEFTANRRLTTRLQDDAQAANQWNTAQGGGLKAIGTGGAIMGFGGKLVIGDDLHKGWVEAKSVTERRKVADWVNGTLMNRVEPGGNVILIGQRLDRDDIFGYLVKHSKEPWKLIRLPALAKANDPMGRAIGEPVCPERYNKKAMEDIYARTTADVCAAVYDQDPDDYREGLTYRMFNAENVRHMTLQPDAPLFVTFDFNVNPGMHALIGQADLRNDRINFRYEIHGSRMKTPECARAAADAIKATRLRFSKVIVYGDRSGKTENTQTTRTDYTLIGQVFREQSVGPVEFHVPEANPPIKSRVDAMNDALCDRSGERHLLVHPDCKRLINDFENVADDEAGLPDKGDSDLTHAADAAGYAIVRIRPLAKSRLFGGACYAPPPGR